MKIYLVSYLTALCFVNYPHSRRKLVVLTMVKSQKKLRTNKLMYQCHGQCYNSKHDYVACFLTFL